jgi:hypothetical protein
MKAEKSDKPKNIVLGSYDKYKEIYSDLFKEYFIEIRDDLIFFNEKSLEKMYDDLEVNFLMELIKNIEVYSSPFKNNDNKEKEFKEKFIYRYTYLERKEIIEENIKRKNFEFSIYGILSGLISTDPFKIVKIKIEINFLNFKKIFFDFIYNFTFSYP